MSRAPKDFYEINGRLLPRVTSITKIVGDKESLLNWVARTEKDAAINAAVAAFGAIDPRERFGTSPLVFESMVRAHAGAGRANEGVSDKAKLIGNEAHKRMEWVVNGRQGPEPPVSVEAAIAVAAGENFVNTRAVKPVLAESVVYSEKYRFAGTLDLLAKVAMVVSADTDATPPAGERLAVCDWKTSKAIYPEARMQVAAYAIAVDEMGHGPVEEGLIIRLPKTTEDPGFETISMVGEELESAKQAFLGALACWNWLHAQKVAYAKSKAVGA